MMSLPLRSGYVDLAASIVSYFLTTTRQHASAIWDHVQGFLMVAQAPAPDGACAVAFQHGVGPMVTCPRRSGARRSRAASSVCLGACSSPFSGAKPDTADRRRCARCALVLDSGSWSLPSPETVELINDE